MRKQILWTILALCTGLMLAQGGISGTGQVTVTNLPPFTLYGMPVQFGVAVNLSGVSGSASVGLGGFVVPIGFDTGKFVFGSAANSGLPGDPLANPPTMTFVNTDPAIANANGFVAVVGATSVDSVGPNYTVANVVGWPIQFGTIALDMTAPAGAPAQVALSLSSKWTASNGGPANIPAAAADNSLSVKGRLTVGAGDYDGDGKSDLVVYGTDGSWYIYRSAAGYTYSGFGGPDFAPVPGNWDNDNLTDLAVYGIKDGYWHIFSSISGYRAAGFGGPGYIPLPGDYDGDGITDLAVYKDGYWYINGSTIGYYPAGFGGPNDIPVPGDYDGDGTTDLAVYSSGTWYIMGSTVGYFPAGFGGPNDIPVPADYDGDGTTDLAVYSAGMWYIFGSTTGYRPSGFGGATDIPVPADYDGDGSDDLAVYSAGTWYIYGSTVGYYSAGFGGPQYVAIPK